MNFEARLTVGIGEDMNRRPITPDMQYRAIKAIAERFADTYGGVSYHVHKGAWLNDAHQLVTEESVTFTSIATELEPTASLRELAHFAIGLLNQECVLCVINRLDKVEFVSSVLKA